MQHSLISLRHVSKQYPMGKVIVNALSDVDIVIEGPADGEQREGLIALCGPSGSGKSTLLNIIGCLDRPTAGTVSILGHDVLQLNDNALSELRNQSLGFIFQTFNLIPLLNAYENVEYPLLLAGVKGGERRERVATMLRSVGLEQFATHQPAQLSGGQQQRVAIARALVSRPRIVLADEPTANLDTATGMRILELMHDLRREFGCTFVLATHDLRLLKFADRIVHLVDGRIQDTPVPVDLRPGAEAVK